jgi:hypothetical protein
MRLKIGRSPHSLRSSHNVLASGRHRLVSSPSLNNDRNHYFNLLVRLAGLRQLFGVFVVDQTASSHPATPARLVHIVRYKHLAHFDRTLQSPVFVPALVISCKSVSKVGTPSRMSRAKPCFVLKYSQPVFQDADQRGTSPAFSLILRRNRS